MDSTKNRFDGHSPSKKAGQNNARILAIGVILITLLFIAYNYFSDTSKDKNQNTLSFLEDKLYEIFARFEKEPGQIDDFAAMDVRDPYNVAGSSDEWTASRTWIARDYKVGDIKVETGTYTVKSGDTLWEISEAVYGDGMLWHKILDANSNTIGFLPNGSQALIVPGQVLTIP